jgi:hypothetical protein
MSSTDSENTDPNLAIPKSDTDEPNRAKLLMESEAPISPKSNTDTDDPMRAIPNSENDDPRREKLRRETDAPR